jgi:hypothetical protein
MITDGQPVVAAAAVEARAQPEAKQGEYMDFGNYLQKGMQILQLEVKTIREASKDEEALLPALLFFALAGLANGAGQFSFRVMIVGPILATLLSFVLVGLLSVLARLFGSTASFLELYRPLGLAAPVQWVQAVPFIGPFLGFFALIYLAVVAALTLETTGEISRAKAAAVVALLVGISLFLFLVFFAMVGSLLLFRTLFS